MQKAQDSITFWQLNLVMWWSFPGGFANMKAAVLKGSWGTADAWHHVAGVEFLKRAQEAICSGATSGDLSILEMLRLWDSHQGQNHL